MIMDNPILALSGALAHACYEGFGDYSYRDRDWEKFGKWRETVFVKLSKDEQKAMYDAERSSGKHMGPEDCTILRQRKHRPEDIEVEAMFSQTWGSTALGFGGIGGAAMTSAYVTVLNSRLTGEYCVYFAGSFAYKITQPNVVFFNDIQAHNMSPVKIAKGKYEREN